MQRVELVKRFWVPELKPSLLFRHDVTVAERLFVHVVESRRRTRGPDVAHSPRRVVRIAREYSRD